MPTPVRGSTHDGRPSTNDPRKGHGPGVLCFVAVAGLIGLSGCGDGSAAGPATPSPLWTQGRAIDRTSPSTALESILKANASGMLSICDELVPDSNAVGISQNLDVALQCELFDRDAAVEHRKVTDITVESAALMSEDSAVIKGSDISAPTLMDYDSSAYPDEAYQFVMVRLPDGWHLSMMSRN